MRRCRFVFPSRACSWHGKAFIQGVDHPLDLRLSEIVVTDQAGRRLVAAPSAHLTFSLAGLLLGRIVPRSIEVDHAQIAVTREAGGAINLGGNLAGGVQARLGLDRSPAVPGSALAPGEQRSWAGPMGLFDQIQRAHFRDAEVTFRDQESGLVVRTADMNLDLVRARTGQIDGLLRAPLSIGDQQRRPDGGSGLDGWFRHQA